MRSRFGSLVLPTGMPDGSPVVALDLHGAPVWETCSELVPASPSDGERRRPGYLIRGAYGHIDDDLVKVPGTAALLLWWRPDDFRALALQAPR